MVKKIKKGKVVSAKMYKTVVMEEVRLISHPLYQKKYKVKKKFKAHDPENKCQKGDSVLIEETRPISSQKKWQVVKILKKREEEKGEEK